MYLLSSVHQTQFHAAEHSPQEVLLAQSFDCDEIILTNRVKITRKSIQTSNLQLARAHYFRSFEMFFLSTISFLIGIFLTCVLAHNTYEI